MTSISREEVLSLYADHEDIFSVNVEILARLEIEPVDVALMQWSEDGAESDLVDRIRDYTCPD